jgi:hypothetical protein
MSNDDTTPGAPRLGAASGKLVAHGEVRLQNVTPGAR